MSATVTIRVMLPAHLRNLARVGAEVSVETPAPATIASTLDALEARYPVLAGTIRDHDTRKRRAFIRYFACEEDLSHEPPETALPEPVVAGREPLIILGAIAGG
ncbi:MAG TPA: MoaD/ThiS family protein [Acidobacteriaceae bacterium]